MTDWQIVVMGKGGKTEEEDNNEMQTAGWKNTTNRFRSQKEPKYCTKAIKLEGGKGKEKE